MTIASIRVIIYTKIGLHFMEIHVRITARNITSVLKQRLEAGEYIDAMLPSERELATEFSVARVTIRRALDDLLSEGHLQRMGNRVA